MGTGGHVPEDCPGTWPWLGECMACKPRSMPCTCYAVHISTRNIGIHACTSVIQADTCHDGEHDTPSSYIGRDIWIQYGTCQRHVAIARRVHACSNTRHAMHVICHIYIQWHVSTEHQSIHGCASATVQTRGSVSYLASI